ncbi:FOG: FHA domain [Alteromonadaceae bacterium Bs31]|nr:FOG: FHA domain [Alteromonadaceae bacterium Bs31]
MLKVRYKNKQKDPFWITERVYSIGSADDNNLSLTAPSLSPHHAKLVREQDAFLLRDLGSTTGTFVNGQRITSKAVCCGDVISLGKIELQIVDPLEDTADLQEGYWSLIGDSSWLAGQEFPLLFSEANRLLLGRGKHCNIVFPGTHLSREHAVISKQGDTIAIEDLKSANATYVNDKRVDTSPIKAGDRIRLDVYSFLVFGPGIALHKSATRKVQAPPQSLSGATTAPATKEQGKTAVKKPAGSRQRKQSKLAAREKPAYREKAVLPVPRDQNLKQGKLTNWLLVLLLVSILLSITLRVLIA